MFAEFTSLKNQKTIKSVNLEIEFGIKSINQSKKNITNKH